MNQGCFARQLGLGSLAWGAWRGDEEHLAERAQQGGKGAPLGPLLLVSCCPSRQDARLASGRGPVQGRAGRHAPARPAGRWSGAGPVAHARPGGGPGKEPDAAVQAAQAWPRALCHPRPAAAAAAPVLLIPAAATAAVLYAMQVLFALGPSQSFERLKARRLYFIVDLLSPWLSLLVSARCLPPGAAGAAFVAAQHAMGTAACCPPDRQCGS